MPTENPQPSPRKPLRLWPGVVVVLIQWLGWLAIPAVVPEAAIYGIIGGIVGGAVIAAWWLFFSRAPWPERIGAIVVMALALAVTSRLVHVSIATGMMGMMLFMYAIPVLSLVFVAWAVATRRLPEGLRRASLVAAIVVACGMFTLLRTEGMTGNADSDFEWRWTRSAEERLVAQAGEPIAAPASAPAAVDTPATPAPAEVAGKPATTTPAPDVAHVPDKERVEAADAESSAHVDPTEPRISGEWPGFRGPERDGVLHHVRIATDWAASPPKELWRRPIGPGWSSFAVHGTAIYTQEQRGEDEVVASYDLATGEAVWQHRDHVRFWESNGGAGPRATPTLSRGRVYTFGATGILNALDETTGARIWSRDVAADSKKQVPAWGFSGSPLVVDDLVIVAAAGKLEAYDAATGEPRWSGPAAGGGYSSPHLATFDGVAQVVLANGAGAISVDPASGTLLWKHAWPGDGILQPAVTGSDVLLANGSGIGASSQIGLRRVAVKHGTSGWSAEERWTSSGLKPYFNDFVVHKGHAFGFDGSILACVDLEDGARKWKGGRYGHGQFLLLPDQDVLLVLSEEGELALVGATPDQFKELARFKAIEGKTWNHPVLAGDILLVRNGEEMVAFRLALAGK